jgi:hypothetical protein
MKERLYKTNTSAETVLFNLLYSLMMAQQGAKHVEVSGFYHIILTTI